MRRLLPLSMLLFAASAFAEPVPLEINTAVLDAQITASLEARVAGELDRLNNIGFGVVTIVDVTNESELRYNAPFESRDAEPLL